ncbi:MAG: glutathione peroxidase [Saprospiraceae bacterium]|nr:glutathione peroxidase [Saprospiraceae bacterium]
MRIGILLITLSLPAWFWSCFNGNKVASAPKETISATNQEKPSFYDLKVVSLDGETVDMSKYKGKKIIVLNVASNCGYTPQYADWQKFYESNKDQVEVLGFPCNQFLGQEPGSSDEIATFCQKNYGVTFQMFDKVDVKGDQQHAIYQWLTDPSKNGWNSEVPSWNFCKYLINEEGKLTHFFGSKIKPDNQEFMAAYK